MRQIALPIALCLLASYGCAASEDSMPAGTNPVSMGGSLGNVAGSTSTGGTGAPIAGSTTTGTAGSTTTGTGGTTTTGTAGTSTGTAGTSTGTAGTGTGGTGPLGGTCMTKAASTGMPLLIDDFEDGNADVMPVDGRMGGWYLSTDMTGTSTPKSGPPVPEAGGMPGKAIHVTGKGLTSWGASLSAAIANNMTGCYDASKFTGISVSLKGTGMVMVSVLTAAVRDAPMDMRNQYKKVIALSADWTNVPINFSELTQPGGWGLMVPFDATKIYGFDIGPVAAPPAMTDYDIWVDNLSFK